MAQTPDTDIDTELTVETDYEAVVASSSLLTLLGDHSKARILRALLASYPAPLNPARIAESSGLDSRQSWYNHKDTLLATGLVVQDGHAGNSPLYRLAHDDERVDALRVLRDLTGAHLRDAR